MSNIDTTVSAIKEIAMWHEHQADNSMPSFATTKMHRQYAANLFALAAEKEEIEGIQSEFAPEKFGGIADSLYAMSAEMRGLRTLLVKKEMEPVYKAFSAPQPAAPSDAGAVPEGWVPLTITFEEGYPEEVAYGPKRMMDRLKKWLDKFYELRLAAAPEAPQADTGDVWIRHDDDLRYVKRVLEAGDAMTPQDQRDAIKIVNGLRTTARLYAQPSVRGPLSDEEILTFVAAAPALDTAEAEWLYVARAIEFAHGITGTQGGGYG